MGAWTVTNEDQISAVDDDIREVEWQLRSQERAELDGRIVNAGEVSERRQRLLAELRDLREQRAALEAE